MSKHAEEGKRQEKKPVRPSCPSFSVRARVSVGTSTSTSTSTSCITDVCPSLINNHAPHDGVARTPPVVLAPRACMLGGGRAGALQSHRPLRHWLFAAPFSWRRTDASPMPTMPKKMNTRRRAVGIHAPPGLPFKTDATP